MIKYLISLVFLLVMKPSFAQLKDTLAPKNAIKIIAQATPDKILLRWAANTPYAWKMANEQGYIVEKQLVAKAGKLITPRGAFVKLAPQPIKPLPLNEWEPIVKSDKMAPIAAQSLYGKTFAISQGKQKNPKKGKGNDNMIEMLNQATELENRHTFALFAADMSVITAKASGLFWEDKTVVADEMYLYRVYASIRPKNTLPIDTGFVYVGISDYRPLPRIRQIEGEFSDKSVLLSWDRNPYNQFFSAFIVERSDDNGKTFKNTSDLPFVNTQPVNAKQEMRKNYKVDSLPENGKTYFFRVKGLNAFGQVSLPSDTVSGVGYIPLRGNPSITKIEEIKGAAVKIEWDFPKESISEVKGYSLERCETEKGTYQILNTSIFPITTTNYVDLKPPKRSNYYRVRALGKKKGEYALSFPYRVLLQDSLPPMPPTNVKGVIDSTGIVSLSWKKNTEQDLYGYRVFRSNFKNQEFSQISKEPIRTTFFKDTVSIKTLTEKVYYKIVALDEVFNPSGFSELLELKRPDKIPPVPPVIKNYEAKPEGVYLQWYNSSSEDVEKHLLYRGIMGEEKWQLIKVFLGKDTTHYTDKDTDLSTIYKYTIIAIDDAGLESTPAKPIQAKRLDNKIRPNIEKFEVVAEREKKEIKIAWQYNQKGVFAFWIYRSEEGKPLRLLTSVRDATATSYIDKEARLNTIYQYAIRAVFVDEAQSKMTKPIIVKY